MCPPGKQTPPGYADSQYGSISIDEEEDAPHTIETKEMLDGLQDGLKKFTLVPKTILKGKRCFTYCGDELCDCDLGPSAGDEVSIVCNPGGKSLFSEILRKMLHGVYLSPVDEDGCRRVYWDGKCTGRLMPPVSGE
tara:strand:+ start:68 stop:475 length:408 start_codon:yes stop_codon:yes gene_type:complete